MAPIPRLDDYLARSSRADSPPGGSWRGEILIRVDSKQGPLLQSTLLRTPVDLLRHSWLICALLMLLFGGPLEIRAQASRDSDLKAAFLFNFLTFVDWPAEVFSEAESPFVIGVMGSDLVRNALNEIVAGERVGNRPIVVRSIIRLGDIGDCHILYVDRRESWQLGRVLESASGSSILTVADIPGFARNGGIIEFQTESRLIRLNINRQNAREAKLRISSKLLQLARVVDEGQEEAS